MGSESCDFKSSFVKLQRCRHVKETIGINCRSIASCVTSLCTEIFEID